MIRTKNVACVFLLLAAASAALPQAVPPPEPSISVPPAVLYRSLCRHIEALDQEADKVEIRGENAMGLRQHYRQAIGLSAAEDDQLKQFAARTLAAVREVDQRAHAIIQAARAQYAGGRLPARGMLPPPPPELSRLTVERDEVTLREVNALRVSLGEAAFEKFDRHVKTVLAKNVKAVDVPRPEPGSVQPLPTGGQR